MTNVNTAALRELPEPGMREVNPYLGMPIDPHDGKRCLTWYTADQMRAYAQPYADRLAALEAGMRGLMERWRRMAASPAFPDEDDRPVIEAQDAMRIEHADELSALLNRPADGGK